jgi:hypothetical protein
MFVLAFWYLVWRRGVIWSRDRILHSWLLVGTSGLILLLGPVLVIAIVRGSDREPLVLLCQCAAMMIWLIGSVFVWRETATERAARTGFGARSRCGHLPAMQIQPDGPLHSPLSRVWIRLHDRSTASGSDIRNSSKAGIRSGKLVVSPRQAQSLFRSTHSATCQTERLCRRLDRLVDQIVAVGQRDEPCLELARREHDAGVEHGAEKA